MRRKELLARAERAEKEAQRLRDKAFCAACGNHHAVIHHVCCANFAVEREDASQTIDDLTAERDEARAQLVERDRAIAKIVEYTDALRVSLFMPKLRRSVLLAASRPSPDTEQQARAQLAEAIGIIQGIVTGPLNDASVEPTQAMINNAIDSLLEVLAAPRQSPETTEATCREMQWNGTYGVDHTPEGYSQLSIVTWVNANGGEAQYINDPNSGVITHTDGPVIAVRTTNGWAYAAPGHFVAMGDEWFQGELYGTRNFHVLDSPSSPDTETGDQAELPCIHCGLVRLAFIHTGHMHRHDYEPDTAEAVSDE